MNFYDQIPNKNFIYQDEVNDLFVLTKYGEIYPFSNDLFIVNTWSPSMASKIERTFPIIDMEKLSDGITQFKIELKYLEKVMGLKTFKRRPHQSGTFIKYAEEKLGHKIHIFHGRCYTS